MLYLYLYNMRIVCVCVLLVFNHPRLNDDYNNRRFDNNIDEHVRKAKPKLRWRIIHDTRTKSYAMAWASTFEKRTYPRHLRHE